VKLGCRHPTQQAITGIADDDTPSNDFDSPYPTLLAVIRRHRAVFLRRATRRARDATRLAARGAWQVVDDVARRR